MFNIGGETYSIAVISNLGKKSCNINLIKYTKSIPDRLKM